MFFKHFLVSMIATEPLDKHRILKKRLLIVVVLFIYEKEKLKKYLIGERLN